MIMWIDLLISMQPLIILTISQIEKKKAFPKIRKNGE